MIPELEPIIQTARSTAGTGLTRATLKLNNQILVLAELVNNDSTLLNAEHGEIYIAERGKTDEMIGLKNGWVHAGCALIWKGCLSLKGSYDVIGLCDHDASIAHVLHTLSYPLKVIP